LIRNRRSTIDFCFANLLTVSHHSSVQESITPSDSRILDIEYTLLTMRRRSACSFSSRVGKCPAYAMFGGVQGLYQSLYDHFVSCTCKVVDKETHLVKHILGAINDLDVISEQYCKAHEEKRSLPLSLLDLSMKLHSGLFEQGSLLYCVRTTSSKAGNDGSPCFLCKARSVFSISPLAVMETIHTRLKDARNGPGIERRG